MSRITDPGLSAPFAGEDVDPTRRRRTRIPAAGSAGVLAKAKAWLDSDSYDVQEGATLAESLCQDIERLFAADGMAHTEATGL